MRGRERGRKERIVCSGCERGGLEGKKGESGEIYGFVWNREKWEERVYIASTNSR